MVNTMPQHQRRTLWKYWTAPEFEDISFKYLQLRGYGCAVSRRSNNDTAYAHRNAKIKLQYGVHWQHPNETEEHEKWLQDLYVEMYGPKGPVPGGTMDGCYVSYPNRNLVDWQHLYFKGNYERLKEVKKQWDPFNIFGHRQSIELA